MALVDVTYRGFSDIRILPAADLAQHGVSTPADLVFARRPRDGKDTLRIDLGSNLEKILREDGGFEITAVTDSGNPGEVVSALDEETVGKVVIEDETGKTKG